MQRRTHSVTSKGQFFPVILQEETDGGYFVSCPSFDGCFSQGETVEDALTNIKEAIELCAAEEKSRFTSDVSVHMVRV